MHRNFQSVSIPTFVVRENSFVEYKIELLTATSSWSVWRRYSEFCSLHEKIKKFYKVPDLPPKKFFRKTSHNLSETRRISFEEYVRALLLKNESSVLENKFIIEFFELKGKFLHKKLLPLNRWINECEALNILSNEINNLLNEQLGLHYGQNSEGYSPEIRTKIRNFEIGIKELYESLQKNGSRELTEGELVRRYNMVHNLRGKLNELQRKEKESRLNFSLQKNALLKGSCSPKPARVWGRETNDTADKSSGELVKYQRNIMSLQDEGIDRLNEIVQKQKSIAERIGNELDEQNKMIEFLDSKMERTGGHMENTTRRVKSLL
jgi:hypothetical protein